ncbi:MAG: copper-binding protein [Algisphaera sp.]
MRVGLLFFISLFFTSFLLGGCDSQETPQITAPSHVDVYLVRGVVKALPSPENLGSELMVQHEAIPSFIGMEGQSSPMPAMTMPFPTPEGVLTDAIKVGDKVELKLEVTRGPNPGFEATAITPLAADLELNLNTTAAGHGGHDDHAGHSDHAGHDHATH